MTTSLFIPDRFHRAFMRKGWALLVVWIGELARLAAHPLAEYRINQNAARALLRRRIMQ